MPSWRDLQAARRQGSLGAQRARRRLGLAVERRVDIFAVIEAEGIWLMFQPLDDLFGFYRRIADVAGIVVQTKHPESLQRYTAAHEYGHHVLGHGFSLDEARNIDGARGLDEAQDLEAALAARSAAELGDPLQEAAAQAFAATFLMPIQVVNRALLDRGLDRDHPHLEPADVYALSLEFGTSYEATVTQLAVLEKITWSESRQLRVPPIKIKTALARGRPPLDSRADLWLIHHTDDHRDLRVRTRDEILLRLPEVPSSGYAWTTERRDLGVLEVIDEFVTPTDNDANDAEVYGGGAFRDLRLRAAGPGSDEISVSLMRPWEETPLETIIVSVHVAEEPTGESTQGLIRSQQLQRVRVA
jgi:Zn-dependent peptidase ImmA (M78 family)/predicted secreted protein